MRKNDIITLEIEDASALGSGIGKYEGMAVFVPLTAVGDKALVRIVKVKKSYAYGKLEELIEPSAHRIKNTCNSFKQCGGCVFRHISYESECELKQKRVYETVKRIGGIDMMPQPIVCKSECDRYRNKAQYPINENGKAGFFAVHSHRVIPCGDCLLQPKEFYEAVSAFENWIEKNGISVYSEETKKGLLRHLYLRKAVVTDEIMAVVVINGNSIEQKDKLIECFKNALGDKIKSIQLNINKKDTNVILGEENICIYGSPFINDVLCGVKIRLSPLSFYQVNHGMAELLYKKAAEYVKPEGKTVLDLYCGAGTIGLSMAQKAKKIIGVEIVPQAVEDAKENARENGTNNAEFLCGDALAAADLLKDRGVKPDAVIVDPPRKGCTEELLSVIANGFAPERFVYISCDVATLARDISVITKLGYKLEEYTPFDLFPRTSHVETVALLVRTDSVI